MARFNWLNIRWVLGTFLLIACLLLWGHILRQFVTVENINGVRIATLNPVPLEAVQISKMSLPEMVQPLLKWDATWYIRIARDGYQQHPAGLAFPPLYPLLTWGVGGTTGLGVETAAVLIACAAFIGSCFMLIGWAARQDLGTSEQDILFSIIFFPSAFFFFAGYSESLFLLLILAAWGAANRSQWHWAGLIGAAAVLTRFLGVFLIFPLGMLFWEQVQRKQVRWRSILWLGLIPTALAGWSLIALLAYGTTPTQALAQGWPYMQWSWPWTGILTNLAAIASGVWLSKFHILLNLIAVITVIWSSVWWFKRQGYPEAVFMLSSLLFSVMKVGDSGVLISVNRYVLPLFPIYLSLAWVRRHSPVGRLTSYIFLVLWFAAVSLFLIGFWIA